MLTASLGSIFAKIFVACILTIQKLVIAFPLVHTCAGFD